MVCIPFHTFVNTIRYKSNHPHNIIPEYAECQYRKCIIIPKFQIHSYSGYIYYSYKMPILITKLMYYPISIYSIQNIIISIECRIFRLLSILLSI